jgi:peptidyl-prolyl cis-trans isomerase C
MPLVKHMIALGGAIASLALVACNGSQDKQATAPVAAAVTVNGVAIPRTVVDAVVKERTVVGQLPKFGEREAIIDQLAMQLVLAQEATKQGLDKTPEFAQRLEMSRQAVLATTYVNYLRTKNPVTDVMLMAEYERIKADSANAREYKARHILVADEAQAQSIIAKLKAAPTAFAALAAQYSLDTSSKPNGGDLGWGNPRGMGPEFSAALTGLEKGKFTEAPVKTQFGYHVILLEDTRVGEILPMSALRADISQKLAQENLEKQLEALKAAAKIELPTEKTAAQPKSKISTAPQTPTVSAAK